MKKIKICFLDFWQGFDYHIMNFYILLTKRYDVEVMDNFNDADYVFFSCFGDEHWQVPLSKVKIFYTAENICPDFNTCDYAVGFEWMEYGDRYLRFSNAYSTAKMQPILYNVQHKHEPPYDVKKAFCSFVVSNGEAADLRMRLFEKLSRYKKVDSGGRWMNNIGGPVADKLAFDMAHKFSICCENSSHSGYTTEKLYQAFGAKLIPIYWGDPDVGRVFNPKAYINVSNYTSLDEAIEYIKKVDCDDELYQSIISEPAFLQPESQAYEYHIKRMADFMYGIFDQPIEKAYRFNRHISHFYYPAKIAKLLKIKEMGFWELNKNYLKRQLIKLILKIRK